MRIRMVAIVVGVAALLIAGCGGGGGNTPPPPQDTSSIDGRVDIQGAAGDYEVLLDGQPVPGALREDGTYTIENVPPGQHRIAVVARDGMNGGYATVDVPEGERTEAPEITPQVGGQIVGIVTVIEDGVLRPLEGVEVTAQPAVMIMAGDETRTDPNTPTIYPPPDDLPTFSAFTDANGSYVIRAVPQGEYTVSVSQPEMEGGWSWVWVEAGRTAVADFQLRPAIEEGVGTVQGRVTGVLDGDIVPLSGARVTIFTDVYWEPIGPPTPAPMMPGDDESGGGDQSEPGYPGMPDPGLIMPPYYGDFSTITDANGDFSLNAPAGYATIEVYLPGWMPMMQEIEIRPDQTLAVDFELEAFDEPPFPPEEGGPGVPPEGEPPLPD